MSIPEATLITQARNGDTQAFATLYQHTHKDLTRIITARQRRYTPRPDPQLTEDIVSETYTRAFPKINAYTDQGRPFIAWLTTIACNLLSDHMKSSGHQRTRTFTHIIGDDTWITFDRADLEHVRPEYRTLLGDEFDRLIPLIHQLTGRQRDVLLRRYYYGLTIEETALEMGVSQNVVKTRCGTAIASLRRLHEARYPSDHAGAT